jgi:2-phosphoglycerate kinase
VPTVRALQGIFIYGVPGSGKTTIGRGLAERLGYRFVEADRVRDQARDNPRGGPSAPFLVVGTTEAWGMFGDLSPSTAMRGLIAVRDALALAVANEIKQQRAPFVMEAAFLRPRDVRRVGPVLLVITEDEYDHEQHFFEHRLKERSTVESFRAARMLQDYLIQEAAKASIPILSNRDAVDETIAYAVGLIQPYA